MATFYAPHLERLHALAASGSLLAFGGSRDAVGVGDAPVQVLALPRGELRATLAVPAPVHALCFLAADWLCAAADSGALYLWRLNEATAAPVVLAVGTQPLRALAYAADSGTLAVVDDAGTLTLYQVDTVLTPLSQRSLSPRPLRTVALHGNTVAAAGDEGVIYTLPLSAAATATPRAMPVGRSGIGGLALTGDGRVVAGCGDGTVWLCFLEGAADEENRAGDNAHKGKITALWLTPTADDNSDNAGQRLYTLSVDGELKIWPLDNRRKPRTLELSGKPQALALTEAVGNYKHGLLVAATHSRRVLLYPLDAAGATTGKNDVIESQFARLAADLGQAGQSVRETALKALADLPEDDARILLEQAFSREKMPPLRALICTLLADGNRRLSRPLLRQALDDAQPSVRLAAFKALQRLENEALVSLQAALACRHDDLRLTAVKQLPALRDQSPLAVRLLVERLTDSAATVRQAALDGLLHGTADADVPGIVRTVLSRSPADTRCAALIALSRRGLATTLTGRQLLGSALDDSDNTVRETALWLSIGNNPRLYGHFQNVNGAKEALAKLAAQQALPWPDTRTPTEDDRAPLFTALGSRQPGIAVIAANALALLGDSRAVGVLLQLSREPTALARRFAVSGLQNAAIALPADGRLRQRLVWLLNDPDAGVRADAFNALLNLDNPLGAAGEVELAATALKASQADSRGRALPLLVKHGLSPQPALSARADSLLALALDDEDPEVRNEAFRTLWAWHSKRPETTLRRATACAHADIRLKAVAELARQKRAWSRELLVDLIKDRVAEVGLAAYKALTEEEKDRKKAELHLAALHSPRSEVQVAGLKGAQACSDAPPLRNRLIELVQVENAAVHIAAIETLDKLLPGDAQGLALAFDSPFYALRVRAGELCGKRRDQRATGPMQTLLAIPASDLFRPAEALRERAARALADIGDPAAVPFFVTLLDDPNGLVQEMAARGLATACTVATCAPLVTALAHASLAVRSWAAEGLARLNDVRALPVLAGTQRHDHAPIRKGALLGFVALGEQGTSGLLAGLEDPTREVQDLVFAIIVARDIALARAQEAPDLLLAALSSTLPEIRYSAARVLEARINHDNPADWALALVGPRPPEQAEALKTWPEPAERGRLLNGLITRLASDDAAQRYAAVQVLNLRTQPDGFWREAAQLNGVDTVPHTNWEDETPQPRQSGWLRSLFGERKREVTTATQRVLTVLRFVGNGRRAPGEDRLDTPALQQLVFGVYAGLVRQAPVEGADDYQRVRRDSIERLAGLAEQAAVGRAAVLPVLAQALNDPHHLVRRAALTALSGLYPDDSLEVYTLALGASAADVGRQACDRLLERALNDDPAALAVFRCALDAPVAEVRRYALDRLPRLYPPGSLEPWLAALASSFADVRLAVVDRLADSSDGRVLAALNRALESEHEDLRFKAAVTVAGRGEARALEVLAGFLHSEQSLARQALEALIALVHARPDTTIAAAAARTVAARLSDDPDKTADRGVLLDTLRRIGHPDGVPVLRELLFKEEETALRPRLLDTLLGLLREPVAAERLASGRQRVRYREPLAFMQLAELAEHPDATVRAAALRALGDVQDARVTAVLALRLEEDREEPIQALAAAMLGQRAREGLPGADLGPLKAVLRSDRRELLLAAALQLADIKQPEAFQPLVLFFKAGEPPQRQQALLALGRLGVARALEHLEPLLDPRAELPADDRALAPTAAEALGLLLPQLTDAETQERVRATLERLALEASGMLRRGALTGLRHVGTARSRTLLERVAADVYDEMAMRRHAIDELGQSGDERAEAALAPLLDDDDASLSQNALAALRVLLPEQATRVQLLALASRHAALSQPAATALARSGEPAVLLARLGEIEDATVRRRLRYGLLRRGGFAPALLEPLLADARPTVRAEAAWLAGGSAAHALGAVVAAAASQAAAGWQQAMNAIGSPTAGDTAQAETDAWTAALWACRQLGVGGERQVREALTDGRVPTAVRLAAIRLAGAAAKPDATLLRPLLSDADPTVRAAAAALLPSAPVAALFSTRAGRRQVLPTVLGQQRLDDLLTQSRADDDDVRLAAIAALGRHGGAAAVDALQALLNEAGQPDKVRAQVFRALKRAQRTVAAVAH